VGTLYSSYIFLQVTNLTLTATVRNTEIPGAKERPVIAPAQLINLSLYSRKYAGFMVIGWPDNLRYPPDATHLWPDKSGGPIKTWYPYLILQAFYIGTKSGEGEQCLLKFLRVNWCTCSTNS
jgi:hypothetical protein